MTRAPGWATGGDPPDDGPASRPPAAGRTWLTVLVVVILFNLLFYVPLFSANSSSAVPQAGLTIAPSWHRCARTTSRRLRSRRAASAAMVQGSLQRQDLRALQNDGADGVAEHAGPPVGQPPR